MKKISKNICKLSSNFIEWHGTFTNIVLSTYLFEINGRITWKIGKFKWWKSLNFKWWNV